jgi:protease-4
MDSNPSPPPIAPQPPATPPPRISYAPPPSPRRGGRGWMIVAILLLCALAFSLLLNFGQFAAGLGPVHTVVGPRLDEVILEDNSSPTKIAVVDIDGIITSTAVDPAGFTMVDVIKAQFEQADEDDRVEAIVLRVDSPGGEVLASDEIYRVISDFQKESRKPVIASMGNLAASGGYYVSAPCRWIVANELTITGSIGVILQSWNYRGVMDKVGLQPAIYKSGRFKDMLSGQRKPEDIPPEEHAMVQELIDETYLRFQEVVREGRAFAAERNSGNGRPLVNNWTNLADGRILSGQQAFDAGFVDELGNFEDAVDRAKQIAGITTDVNLVRYQQRYTFSDLLRIFGRSESKVVKVDLGIEAPKIEAGRPYFLSPTLLH